MKLNGLILALAVSAPAVAFAGNQSSATLDDHALALAHLADQAEIGDGQLGLQKGVDKAFRDYAQMLLTDHTQTEERVKQLAAGHYANLDDLAASVSFLIQLKQTHDQQVAQLQQASGRDFERLFLTFQRDDHATVIQRFEALTANMSASDPVFRFFQEIKPALEHHQAEAAQLLQQLGQ